MAALCAGVIPLAGVYVVGLLAIIIAGVLSPNVHIAKEAIFSAPTGITSASADYQFPMSGYKVRMYLCAHRHIHTQSRHNSPRKKEIGSLCERGPGWRNGRDV